MPICRCICCWYFKPISTPDVFCRCSQPYHVHQISRYIKTILENDLKELKTFQTSCLLKTSHFFWRRKVSNNVLLKLTELEDTETVLVKIWRCWITYALRRETANISKGAFKWTTAGKMKRGRPRSTWR